MVFDYAVLKAFRKTHACSAESIHEESMSKGLMVFASKGIVIQSKELMKLNLWACLLMNISLGQSTQPK